MDVTKIQRTNDEPGKKTFDLELSTAPGGENLVVVVAYWDKDSDEVTIRTDNYHIIRSDSAWATIRSMEAFKQSMDREGLPQDLLADRALTAPPYNLLTDPDRPKGFYT